MPADELNVEFTSEKTPSREAGAVRRDVVRLGNTAKVTDQDWIATEVPIALRYNGQAHAVMMATPCDLEDFALGFSMSEGIIANAEELESIDVREWFEGFEIAMRIPAARAALLANRQRNLSGRTGCGLCGTQRLEDVLRHPVEVARGAQVNRNALHRALAALDASQPINALSGATHAAAWASGAGQILLVREDVGRHNALDKLLGAMAERRVDPVTGFLVLTSRASYEMVQKAAMCGIAVIVAISAPTAMAVHMAQSANVTLIGFARAESCVIYSHAQRITNDEIDP